MKTDARTLAPATQEQIRIQAVAAVENGMTRVKAAEVFGVTRQSVDRWVKAYRCHGADSLKVRKRGPKGEGSRLEGWQAATVIKLITDHHPEQLKLPFVLWTANAVRQLIQRTVKVRVSVRTVRRYLCRWGFTPQKPVRRAYERDDAAVRRWLDEQYPAIRDAAQKEKALIYWGDEMGVRSDHQAGRSYAPKGETPAIPGTGQRFGCNVLSALTNRGHLDFMVFKKGFTSAVFVRFLGRLIKQARRKVFIIVDRHPVHRSKMVQGWLTDNVKHIRLFFLPGYSPELNPDEMVNQDVKTNAVGKKRAHNRPQLMRNVRRYLQQRRASPDLVTRYFHEKSVRYAAH
ncbi:IS630 family transposase [Candidatus Kaiserbacteria bacterium]|nr:IS630 family transposase [Candidatus Kaiserbacteria bacterium]